MWGRLPHPMPGRSLEDPAPARCRNLAHKEWRDLRSPRQSHLSPGWMALKAEMDFVCDVPPSALCSLLTPALCTGRGVCLSVSFSCLRQRW